MRKTLCLCLAAAALASCSRTPGNGTEQKFGEVRIEPVITRVTETDFETGDQIGVSINKESGAFVTNKQFTYDGKSFVGGVDWYQQGMDASSFVAYHPYSAAGVPTEFAVQTDQSKGTSSSDLVYASKSDVYPTAGAVTMEFKHKLVRLRVEVSNETKDAITDVVVKNSLVKANLDASFVPTATGEAADVKAFKASENLWYAILVPQTAAITLAVTSNGTTLEQGYKSIDLVSGSQYTIKVRVLPNGLEVKLSGALEAWTDGGELEADVPATPEGPSFEEYEGFFIYDGVTYKTKKLKDGRTWMTQNLAFVPKGLTPSENYAEDAGVWYPGTIAGTADKTEPGIAEKGYLYDYDTAFGTTITTENFKSFEGAQGICPKGWHIPTRAEMLALVGYSVSGGDHAVETKADAAYYDQGYNGAKITALDADGFSFPFAGVRNKTNFTANGTLLKAATTSKNAVEAYVGKLSMTYFIGSTAAAEKFTKDDNVLNNRQFFALMSTFTTTYTEGRLTVALANQKSGYSLRCVKDSE